MWEQEHRERSSYRQHEITVLAIRVLEKNIDINLSSLSGSFTFCRHMISENTMLYATFPESWEVMPECKVPSSGNILFSLTTNYRSR